MVPAVGSFPFPVEVVVAAAGSARKVAARSSGRLVVVPAVGSFPFPVEVVPPCPNPGVPPCPNPQSVSSTLLAGCFRKGFQEGP